MEYGTDVRLYGPKRQPPEWTGIVLRHAVRGLSFRCEHFGTSVTGRQANPERRGCYLRGIRRPRRRATILPINRRRASERAREVFDVQGRAHPPMLVVIHPSQQRLDDPGAVWSRRRRLIATLLLAVAVPMFWIGWRSRGAMILPTFLGISMMLVALRFLHWDFGLKHAQQEREKRLEAHRWRERAGDRDSA